MSGLIKTGITSWTEPSLLKAEAGFYPKSARTAEERLRYYATQFSIVENDSAYYAIPSPEQAALWASRTPEGFTMDVKAYALLTGHYTDPRRLPPDLRAELPRDLRDKRHVYPKDLDEGFLREVAARFRRSIEPLRASGRLGVVLFQFPVWLPASRDNQRRIASVGELVPGCRAAVEFRNATWMSDRNRERTLSLLRDAGLVYTCVDEPQGFVSSVPPIAAVTTSDVALVRFHGRNAATWKDTPPTARERFRYLYSEDELRDWVPEIRHLADQAERVHVLMNNCYSNYAVTNARQLIAMIDGAA